MELSIGSARQWLTELHVDQAALPHAQLSFSICGEDTVLVSHFKRRIHKNIPGIYVDVGCAMPEKASNTYLLYCLGWSGIGIDVNGFHRAAWNELRPRDTFVKTAIMETEGRAFAFVHETNGGMTRVRQSETSQGPEFRLATQVSTRTLADVLSEHLPTTTVDLFSIDVEGSELHVLQSNDWSRWKPEVVLFESHTFDPSRPLEDACVEFLMGRGYRLKAHVGGSVLMSTESE